MSLKGADGLSEAELLAELDRGARVVVFDYCISLLVISFKRASDPYLIRPGESRITPGIPFTLISLLLGWWGIPWGFIYTPWVLITNFGGGRDVTVEVMGHLANAAPEAGIRPAAPYP